MKTIISIPTVAVTFAIAGMAAASLVASPLTPDEEAAWEKLSDMRTPEYSYGIPAPGSYSLPVLQPAADGIVLGVDGKPVRLHELTRDRVVVLSFIYTRCPDPKACVSATATLSAMQEMAREFPELSRRLLLLTLSFDPAFDTPDIMAQYGRISAEDEGAADWLFLTTRNDRDLRPLLDAYGQRVDRRKDTSAGGPFYHPLRVYLIDAAQQIRNIYSFGLLDPRLVLADARTLLLGASMDTPET